MEWFANLNEQVFGTLSPQVTILNLVLVVIAGNILAWHYRRYAHSLGNKRKFARLFVALAATTMMVISVVKTSLALSLGLVGALSIIRFRTPVKEPEDLVYIFLALATGIGFGADQRLATALMFFGVMTAMTFQRGNGSKGLPQLYLHIQTPLGAFDVDAGLARLLEVVGAEATAVDLRRVDSEGDELNATLSVDLADLKDVGRLMGKIKADFPGAGISVVEGGSFE